MGPETLAQVLRPLTSQAAPPELLVGLQAVDDAAVYRVNDQQAVISTADFFPPIVDDPYAFGAIAAANAMSDVYAMGGQVLMAINLVAWPDDLDPGILSEILQGGADTVAQAGAIIAGGHTVSDKEPKYGLAVTGMVHPDHILTKGGAHRNETYLSPHVRIDERLDAFDRELLWDPQTSGGLFAAVDPKVWPALATLAPDVMFWLIGEVTERVEDEAKVVLEVY